MKREHKILIVLIGIVLLASFFRLYDITLSPPGLYPDEAMNGNNALESISTHTYKVFYPENNGREGMFINIQAFFLKIFLDFYPNPEPWMLRVTSTLFGISTVLGIYFLAKELFKKNGHAETIALVSAFFLATSFWHINFSRIGFRAIMAPFFLIWGIFLLLLVFRRLEEKGSFDENSKSQAPNFPPKEDPPSEDKQISNINDQSQKWFRKFGFEILNFFRNCLPAGRHGKLVIGNSIPALLAGMVYGLGMHSYIAYRGTPLLILFIFFLLALQYNWKQVVRFGSLFVLGSIIVSIPLIIYFAENPQDFLGRTSQVSIFSGGSPLKDLGLNIIKTAGMFFVYGDSNWRHNLSGAPELFWPVALFFAIGIIAGIKKTFFRTTDNIQNQGRFGKFRLWILDLFRTYPPAGRHGNFGFSILFMWLIVAALPVIISNEGIPHALRSILMIPPAMILAGVGAVLLYDWIRSKNIPQKFLFTFGMLLFLLIALHTYYTYFILWAQNRETANAFSSSSMDMGKMLNSLPKEIPKYVIVNAGGTLVRGIPMPSQTVMYLTDSFTPEKQKEKNIFYITPDKKNNIPAGSFVVELN